MEKHDFSTNCESVPAQQEPNKELLATAKTSMVLGIVSLGAFTVGDPAAIVVSIIGLVKAKKAKQLTEASNDHSCDNYISVGRTTSTIGLVLGIVLVVFLTLICLIVFLIGFYQGLNH